MQNTSNKIYWVLPTLLLLFLTPMVVAWYFYYCDILYGTVNHGQIIQPPITISNYNLKNPDGTPFPINNIKGSWVMLYVNPQSCDQTCQHNLYNMQQVRIALGKDRDRLQRLLVTNVLNQDDHVERLIKQSYPGTLHAVIDMNSYQELIEQGAIKTIDKKGAALFIVDPQGYIMMSYRSDASAEYILKDLTRLLGVSQIG